MTDQREQVSPVAITGPDEDGIVAVERRGAVYLVRWEPDGWYDDELMMKVNGARWYIRADEDLPIPQNQAYAALGEARVSEAEALVRPKRRLGRS